MTELWRGPVREQGCLKIILVDNPAIVPDCPRRMKIMSEQNALNTFGLRPGTWLLATTCPPLLHPGGGFSFHSAGSGIACLSGVDRRERAWNTTPKIVVRKGCGAAIYRDAGGVTPHGSPVAALRGYPHSQRPVWPRRDESPAFNRIPACAGHDFIP